MGDDFPVLAVYGDFIRAAVDKAEAKVTGGKPVSEPVWPIWGRRARRWERVPADKRKPRWLERGIQTEVCMEPTTSTEIVQHTRGPWRIALPQADGLWGVIADDGYPVAVITTLRQPAEANARLIAAAPELLEAAVFLAGIYRDAIGHGWPELRAAIAKAEGYTS